MNVHKKLMEARVKINASGLKKSGKNDYAGYEYFELGDFLPQVQSVFSELGLCGVVSYENEIATLTIVDVEDNSQILITSPMKDANLKGCHPIQNLGAVETYIRRYLWVTALEIVEHDALNITQGKGLVKPPRESAKSITKDVWDSLPPEEQTFLQGVADTVITGYESFGIETAVKALDDARLDNDEKVAIWSRFDSKLRADIKKFNEQLRKAA